MLDRRFVLENPKIIRENLKKRNVSLDLDKLLALEKERRQCDALLQDANGRAKKIAADASLSNDEKREKGREVRQERDQLRAKHAEKTEQANEILALLPNLTHPDAPIGADETANRECDQSKISPPSFNFPVQDHVALGEALDMMDFESASRVSGPGFLYLKNDGVRLERALETYALDMVAKEGFSIHAPPEMVRGEIMAGAGYAPRANESNAYALEGEDLHLIATSEIPLCGIHANKILEENDLPIRMAGTSRCFRSERAAGQASRGLFRVHQFTKVEMVILCRPKESPDMLQELLRIERAIFDGLEIPYRIVEVASGDLGAPAYRKYDMEAWMPARNNGTYAEVTSASDCQDYQARRLGIRYRENPSAKPILAHTLNGTGLALGRAMIAIMENGQKADGTIQLPPILHSYMGAKTLRKPR